MIMHMSMKLSKWRNVIIYMAMIWLYNWRMITNYIIIKRWSYDNDLIWKYSFEGQSIDENMIKVKNKNNIFITIVYCLCHRNVIAIIVNSCYVNWGPWVAIYWCWKYSFIMNFFRVFVYFGKFRKIWLKRIGRQKNILKNLIEIRI